MDVSHASLGRSWVNGTRKACSNIFIQHWPDSGTDGDACSRRFCSLRCRLRRWCRTELAHQSLVQGSISEVEFVHSAERYQATQVGCLNREQQTTTPWKLNHFSCRLWKLEVIVLGYFCWYAAKSGAQDHCACGFLGACAVGSDSDGSSAEAN